MSKIAHLAQIAYATPLTASAASGDIAKVGTDMVLRPSKRNPKVRRWMLLSAAARARADVEAAARSLAQRFVYKNPAQMSYWLGHHGPYVATLASDQGLDKRVAALAMANEGARHLRKERLRLNTATQGQSRRNATRWEFLRHVDAHHALHADAIKLHVDNKIGRMMRNG